GFIQTFTIPTSGSSITKVTTVEHDNYNNYYYSIVQVDADTYIAAYHGYYGGYGAQIRTFTIPVDGSAVTTVYTLKHLSGSSQGYWNSLIALDADTYVLAFMDSGSDGWLKTFTVSADGGTLIQVADLEHDTNGGGHNSLVKVDANTVALAYAGSGDNGYIKTFNIPANGSSITQVYSYKHDGIQGKYNSFVQADSNTYVLAYAGSGNDGYIKTFTIPSTGTSITQVKKEEHDNVRGEYNSLSRISGGSDNYILAYAGPDSEGGSAYDGFIKTFNIPADGSTVTQTYVLEHTDNQAEWNSLVQVDEDTYALAFAGSGDDGYVSTFTVRASDQVAPTISAVTLAADNSTITVTLDEAVFNSDAGSGALEVGDFALSISGGTATLSSATPT
ncbi:uncharacterized protein METZ01_LOCUS297729, partial [marine metagenome]